MIDYVATPERGKAVLDAPGGRGADRIVMDLFRSGAIVRKIRVGSREDTEDLLRWLDVWPVEPVIDSVHSFEDAGAAFRRFESRENFGKVVIAAA